MHSFLVNLFLAVHRLSLVVAGGGYSQAAERGSRAPGFQYLRHTGSVAPRHVDPLGPGIESVSLRW